ncbi:hypothetical protein FGB62_96g15 [Gracilaria domingensis]|nr:hypothetical protein FGB62_96g15 [Gracilaria domingensis]
MTEQKVLPPPGTDGDIEKWMKKQWDRKYPWLNFSCDTTYLTNHLKLLPEIQAELWAFYRLEGNPCAPTVILQHAVAEFLMLEKRLTPAEFVVLKRCATKRKERKRGDYPRRPDILSFCLQPVPGEISTQAASARAVESLRRRHSSIREPRNFEASQSDRNCSEGFQGDVPWGQDHDIIDLIEEEEKSSESPDFLNNRPKSFGVKRVASAICLAHDPEQTSNNRSKRKEARSCSEQVPHSGTDNHFLHELKRQKADKPRR